MEEFELKEEHIKLAQRMYVGWSNCEYGAPEINPKRPYGNSWVVGDVFDILDKTKDLKENEDGDLIFTDADEDFAHDIHREMETALQIILRCKTFETGKFKRQFAWDEWERA